MRGSDLIGIFWKNAILSDLKEKKKVSEIRDNVTEQKFKED